MSAPLLATKLHTPAPPPKVVVRPQLIERINDGLRRAPSFTLISAPAGFGKTTLAGEWAAGCQRPVAWLSLDEGDNDLTRFLSYFVAALQTIDTSIGGGLRVALQSPQPPPIESLLTSLVNEITTVPHRFALVVDDYHVIDSPTVDKAVSFLLEHLPLQMHLVITTREDPQLPLARLRAGGQLTELRITDLRFTPSEAGEFLNKVMGLSLSAEDIALLETRTEGWIAGLQLAAISMQGHQDTAGFIKSFTGSHHFVMDYLVEEVLHKQSESVQSFLLRTSILDRLCGPLCDAVVRAASGSGQETLEYLEHANLFIIPLDNERRWYRYHHLFADLLRQRLQQDAAGLGSTAELHIRASEWYEENGLEIEAFYHATAAKDFERAERLIEGRGMPLHFRGAVAPVLNWLESLPTTVLDAWPSLWTAFASTLLVTGQTSRAEQVLEAAEAALQRAEPDDKNRDLVGRVAAIRATAAVNQHQVETIIAESRRALEYLSPDNLAFRTSTTWKLGFAYHLQGNRTAARQVYTEVISTGQASGNAVFTLMATVGLGALQEADNQLHLAAQTHNRVLQVFGDKPLPFACEAHLGLARICYEWNDLDKAQQHAQQGIQLARQVENNDRFVVGEILLARLKIAEGDLAGAAPILAKAREFAQHHNFADRISEVAAAEVLLLLHQGNLAAANELADKHKHPISQVRVYLAQGDASTALAILESLCREMETKGWEDERLKIMVLQSIVLQAHGELDRAEQLLDEALTLAEPEGFIRVFVDEGLPMAQLLSGAAARGMKTDYIAKLLPVFEAQKQKNEDKPRLPGVQPLIEPLSKRELEVLKLIAQGLSNREISDRLFLALITVKGHNQRIFGKLQVQRRTEAVARARELGLL